MLEINNLTKRKIETKNLTIICQAFLRQYKIAKAEVSLVFIANKKSQELNRIYRAKDKITDVLSFSNPDFKLNKDNFLGEIFINLTEIAQVDKYKLMFIEMGLDSFFFKKNKAKQKRYLLNFIFVHGLLHLLGFDDENEKERNRMLSLGADFLAANALKNQR